METRGQLRIRQSTFPLAILPDLVLLNIFSYINPEDRSNARMVCTKFHGLLEEIKFARVRELEISYCRISKDCPPWSILRMKKQRYFMMNFGVQVHFDSENDCIEFFKEVGQDVTDIKFCLPPMEHATTLQDLGSNWNMREAIKVMPKLKRIYFDSPKLFLDFNFTEPAKNLKIILLSFVSLDQLKQFRTIKHFESIHITCIGGDTFGIIDQFLVVSDEFKRFMDIVKRSNVVVLNYVDVQKEKLEFSDILLFMLTKYQEEFLQNNFLEKLVNLEKIGLTVNRNSESRCFFLHETKNLRTINEVYLFDSNSKEYCNDCMESLIASCPNLINWNFEKIIMDENALQQFVAVTTIPIKCLTIRNFQGSLNNLNLPALQGIQIYTPINQNLNCFNWEPMPHISVLRLFNFTIDALNLKQLTSKCPKVKIATLQLSCFELTAMRTIKNSWRKIKYLSIAFRSKVSKRNLVREFNGKFQRMRHLEIAEMTSNQREFKVVEFEKEHVISIFKKTPTLRRLNKVSYGEYWELKAQEVKRNLTESNKIKKKRCNKKKSNKLKIPKIAIMKEKTSKEEREEMELS